ncbi:hypothetical protein N7610_32515, partial [Priestia megaterium]|nr:hypothetical protein [Priestia megaterium]
MLDLKTYSEFELAEILGVKPNTLRRTYKINLKDYIHSDRYKVSKGVFAYDILGYKEKEKSEFIQLCEQIAGNEVKFPREETAEQILKFLLEEDWTILSNEELGWNLPRTLEAHTVGKYMNLFRKYKILPKKFKKIKRRSFDKETGEIFSDTLDLNKYTYYIVNKQEDIREEIDEEEYRGMQAFIHQSYSE